MPSSRRQRSTGPGTAGPPLAGQRSIGALVGAVAWAGATLYHFSSARGTSLLSTEGLLFLAGGLVLVAPLSGLAIDMLQRVFTRGLVRLFDDDSVAAGHAMFALAVLLLAAEAALVAAFAGLAFAALHR
jgi:hypothetical protein